MPFLRPNEPLKVAVLNGWNFKTLTEDGSEVRLRNGRLLRGRTGATTDGLSGPKWIKARIQDDNTFKPACIHDFGYHWQLEESFDAGMNWQRIRPTKDEVDAILFELCLDNNVPAWECKAIYEAVHEFGQKAWDDDAPLRGE